MQSQFPMQEQFVHLFRNGMQTAAGITQSSLHNVVRLQETQIEMVRSMLEEQGRSAERLAEAKTVEDLVTVQSRLVSAQLQRVAEFWSTVAHTAAQSQQTFITQASQARDFATRSAEDVARAAANQVSRASGSVREGAANNHGKPENRKSA